jgi:hypothetical protein
MLPRAGPKGQGRSEVLWRTLIGDSLQASDAGDRHFPAPIEMAESFHHWVCRDMAIALRNARADEVEDQVFWQNHAMYENFAQEEKLPTRNEISMRADDIGMERVNAGVASGQYFFPRDTRPEWDFQGAMVTWGRSLLITEPGDLGLGPTSTQSGDVVAFIRNTKVPFILRPAQDGYFSLVGEAYIHGFMQGEILEEGPLKFQEIILQ